MVETIIVTAGVVICVLFFGAFLFTNWAWKHLRRGYIHTDKAVEVPVKSRWGLTERVWDWYLSRGALPFWYVFVIDCVILVFCQLMSAYVVRGGEVLVPLFWGYVVLAIGSLPLYYVGMKLLRSYETIVRFSRMEDLARIVCAVFVGTVLVDVVKHFIPDSILPVYPIWQEQMVMLICSVLLMWSVRILAKSLYDSTGQPGSQMRVFVYGTSMESVEAGLALGRDEARRGVLLAMVRADAHEPHVTIKEAALVEPEEDLLEAMVANHADALVVPLKAYPDFFVERKELVQQLTERGMAVMVR